jgi:hypothetical protein
MEHPHMNLNIMLAEITRSRMQAPDHMHAATIAMAPGMNGGKVLLVHVRANVLTLNPAQDKLVPREHALATERFLPLAVCSSSSLGRSNWKSSASMLVGLYHVYGGHQN